MKKNNPRKTIQFVTSIAVIVMLILSAKTAVTEDGLDQLEIEQDIVEMEGSIIATIYNDNLGFISPSIDLAKYQVLKFNTTKSLDGTYFVDSVLKIDVDVNGNLSRELLLGRFLKVLIIIVRHNKKLLPIRGILKRWFIGRPLNIRRINVVSEGNKSIEIPLEFETTEESENASMYILCVGTPRRILRLGPPAFAFNKINVELVYRSTNYYNDTTPPVTTCEIKGKNME